MSVPRLVADIGGTNARFALAEPGAAPTEVRKLRVSEFPGIVEAALTYLGDRRVEQAVFAVATHITGDAIAFTNNPWRFSIQETEHRLGLRKLTVVNDLAAQATAIPVLIAADQTSLKPGDHVPGEPVVLMGPGTGLGVAFVVSDGGRRRVVASEAGHVSFAPGSELQAEILGHLWRQFGHVSTERMLSGPGLVHLAQAIGVIRGEELSITDPREVSRRAAEDRCRICIEALREFSSVLGATAADLAMTVLAGGGVYITGGLCRNLRAQLDIDAMTRAFLAKGRFSTYLATIPVNQVLRPHVGLVGAAAYDAAAQ